MSNNSIGAAGRLWNEPIESLRHAVGRGVLLKMKSSCPAAKEITLVVVVCTIIRLTHDSLRLVQRDYSAWTLTSASGGALTVRPPAAARVSKAASVYSGSRS